VLQPSPVRQIFSFSGFCDSQNDFAMHALLCNMSMKLTTLILPGESWKGLNRTMNINRPTGFGPKTPVRFGQFKVQLVEGLNEDEKQALKTLFKEKPTDTPEAFIAGGALSEKAAKLIKLHDEAVRKHYSVPQIQEVLRNFCQENNVHPVEFLGLEKEIHTALRVAEEHLNSMGLCQNALQGLEASLKKYFPKQKPTLRFEKFADECIRVMAVGEDGKEELKICDLPGRARSIPNNSKVLVYDKPETMQADLRHALTNFANGLRQGLNRELGREFFHPILPPAGIFPFTSRKR
jgi:hypothetical protein